MPFAANITAKNNDAANSVTVTVAADPPTTLGPGATASYDVPLNDRVVFRRVSGPVSSLTLDANGPSGIIVNGSDGEDTSLANLASHDFPMTLGRAVKVTIDTQKGA